MGISRVGEAWQPFFNSESLSWCIPSQVTPESLAHFTQSEWIQKIIRTTGIQPISGTRVLEAGCGTAMYALCLAILGFDVDAFDYNQGALDFARQLEAKAHQANPNLSFNLTQGNLLNIQAKANTYDLVFNQAVLEYFVDADERRQALAEMTRVTRPGGYVAVIVQHTGHPLRQVWKRLGWEGYVNQPPVIDYTPERLAAELRAVGLSDVRVDGIQPWKMFFWYPAWHRRWRGTNELVYLIGRVLERIPLPISFRRKMALQIVAVGRKA